MIFRVFYEREGDDFLYYKRMTGRLKQITKKNN